MEDILYEGGDIRPPELWGRTEVMEIEGAPSTVGKWVGDEIYASDDAEIRGATTESTVEILVVVCSGGIDDGAVSEDDLE